jgi:hypothetical protein
MFTSHRCALAGFALVLLNGCSLFGGGPAPEPQIFAFNYSVQSMTAAERGTLIGDLDSGGADIDDVIPANPCNLTADFTPRPAPGGAGAPTVDAVTVSISGAAGDSGFNIAANSVGPGNLTTTNVAGCQTVDEFEFFAGGQNVVWAIGGEIDKTSFTVGLNGETFASAYFKARLTGYRSSGYTTGEFDFVNVGSNYRVVVGTRSFALNN